MDRCSQVQRSLRYELVCGSSKRCAGRSLLKAAAPETGGECVQGFSETHNYEALLQVMSYKFGAEVHAILIRFSDHKLN